MLANLNYFMHFTQLMTKIICPIDSSMLQHEHGEHREETWHARSQKLFHNIQKDQLYS